MQVRASGPYSAHSKAGPDCSFKNNLRRDMSGIKENTAGGAIPEDKYTLLFVA